MRILRCWICLLLALCCAGMVRAGGVLIVSSDRASAGNAEAAVALVTELQRAGVRDIVQRDGRDIEGMDFSGAALPSLVVSLGTSGLRQVLARDLRVPVIAALIPRQSFDGAVRNAGNRASAATAVALYLDQPIARQLDLVRLSLPAVRRIGVLWGPESVAQQSAFQAAVRTRGLQEVAGHYSGTATLFDTLQAILDDAQVLLAWPDPQVYNSATLANILLTTYRDRVPVLGFSPAYVQAGALMSVHSTPRQIGVQAAQMVRASLQTGGLPPSQYPVDFEVTVNDRVARTLGLELDGPDLAERLHKLERKL